MSRSWLLAALALPGAAHAADILEIERADASSYYTESGNYAPERAIDGKQGTAWVEGDEGSGLGAWIELHLPAEKKVTAVKIWGGDWSSWDYWNRANRPKEIELKFGDDSTQIVTLEDDKHAQTIAIEGGGKATTSVRVRLKSTYSGSTWFDTGISEIQLIGDGAAVTATASSHAKEDGDGNYEPGNAVDGLADSMWCEGAEGDGQGEWLEVSFGAPRTISKMTLINGIGSSLMLWMKANQATQLELAFDGGKTHTLDLGRPSFRPVTLDLPEVTTSKVKITVAGVKPGKEFHDLCLSEVSFSG